MHFNSPKVEREQKSEKTSHGCSVDFTRDSLFLVSTVSLMSSSIGDLIKVFWMKTFVITALIEGKERI